MPNLPIDDDNLEFRITFTDPADDAFVVGDILAELPRGGKALIRRHMVGIRLCDKIQPVGFPGMLGLSHYEGLVQLESGAVVSYPIQEPMLTRNASKRLKGTSSASDNFYL